jgi:6-phosphogluconolactonase
MNAVGGIRKPASSEKRPRVLVFPDATAVAREAATRFVRLSQQFIASDGIFHAALAGGNTPRKFYRLLASDEFRPQVSWNKVHLFWSDERPVPPDHPESNCGMAWKELISRVPIPPANVHRMEAESADLEQAAEKYQDALGRVVPRDSSGFPRLHLIILGLGTDGHTASLFPDSQALRAASRWVDAPFVEHLRGRRLTLTLPVLNAAHHVLFLVTGAEKAEVLRNVVEATAQHPLPAQLVRPADGEVVFLADAAAARLVVSSPAAERSDGR